MTDKYCCFSFMQIIYHFERCAIYLFCMSSHYCYGYHSNAYHFHFNLFKFHINIQFTFTFVLFFHSVWINIQSGLCFCLLSRLYRTTLISSLWFFFCFCPAKDYDIMLKLVDDYHDHCHIEPLYFWSALRFLDKYSIYFHWTVRQKQK